MKQESLEMLSFVTEFQRKYYTISDSDTNSELFSNILDYSSGDTRSVRSCDEYLVSSSHFMEIDVSPPTCTRFNFTYTSFKIFLMNWQTSLYILCDCKKSTFRDICVPKVSFWYTNACKWQIKSKFSNS